MISKPEMGVILQALEKRFRKLTPEQADVYHERLKNYDRVILREAVDDLVDNSKNFPTPGELKMAVRASYAKRASAGNPVLKRQACPQCSDGYVHYERLKDNVYKHYIADCAFCHRGETSIQPQVVQIDDRIFYACERYVDVGTTRFRANPDLQEAFPEAVPLKTNKELREYFDSPAIKKVDVQKIVSDIDLDLPF